MFTWSGLYTSSSWHSLSQIYLKHVLDVSLIEFIVEDVPLESDTYSFCLSVISLAFLLTTFLVL